MEEKMIDFGYRKKIENTQVKVRGDVETENLVKVLSVSAEPNITNTDSMNGELVINGEVCFNVIYLNEQGETKNSKNVAEFETRVLNDSFNAFVNPIVKACSIETKILSGTANEVRMESLVELIIEIVATESFTPFVNEKLIAKNEEIDITNVSLKGNQRINLEEVFDLKDKPYEILSVKSKLIPESYQAGTGYISLNGILIVSICYTISRDEKTEMRAEIFKRNIKEEIEVENLTKDMKLQLNTDIRNCSILANIDGAMALLNIPVDIFYIGTENVKRNLVVDAFSLTNETEITYDTITKFEKYEIFCTTEKIDGNISIGEDETRISRILCTNDEKTMITNAYAIEDGVMIEGMAYVSIIYQIDDDNGTITSMEAEIPYAVKIDNKSIDSTDNIEVTPCILDVSVKLKRGREIDIDMELIYRIEVYKNSNEAIIKDISLKEELKRNDSNLQIYYAKKGDTLWSVAKKLASKPETIMEQNKNLAFPLENNQIVIDFKKY